MSKEVGKIIRRARVSHGYVQKEVAYLLGTNKQAISAYERGAHLPNARSLAQLREVLGDQMVLDILGQIRQEMKA